VELVREQDVTWLSGGSTFLTDFQTLAFQRNAILVLLPIYTPFKKLSGWVWWCTSVIPALRRLRRRIRSTRPAWAT
jgi:hypothetical protein